MLFALVVGRTAEATGARFQLTWTSSVAQPCTSDEELKRAVSARLGRDPFVQVGQGEIAVDGRELPASGGRVRARIVQRDREGRVLGTRDLEATSCEELRRSATFVVFLIVDPDAAFGAPTIEAGRPEGEGEEKPPGKEELSRANGKKPPGPGDQERRPAAGGRASDVAARPPAPRAPPAPRVGVDLGGAVVVSNGLLPRPDIGPALALGVVPRAGLPIRFEWRASYRIAVQPVQGYEFRAVEQEWRACYVRRAFGAMDVTACGGAAWTPILPLASGLARGDQAPKTVFSPTVAAGPAFEIGGTRLFVDLALAFPRTRYAFTYREDGRAMPLHEVSRIVWSLGIGASRSFR